MRCNFQLEVRFDVRTDTIANTAGDRFSLLCSTCICNMNLNFRCKCSALITHWINMQHVHVHTCHVHVHVAESVTRTISVTSTDSDDCRDSPCFNYGQCIDGVDSFTCQCRQGYDTGLLCETGACAHVTLRHFNVLPTRNTLGMLIYASDQVVPPSPSAITSIGACSLRVR